MPLTEPYFCVLPAGTPTPPGGYPDPLPTAGPYYLAEHQGGALAVLRANPSYKGPRRSRLDAIIFQMNIPEHAEIALVQRGRLDYYDGRSVDVSPRVGCRASQPGIPGLDLAALCLRSAVG